MTALTISADEPRTAAILAVADLLARLRTEFAFVGSVAQSAWLGDKADAGAVDLLVTVSPQGKTQLPMMASNRGFIVDREALEAAEELDLIPLRWPHHNDEIRVHALVASNALYGRMVRDAVPAQFGERQLQVIRSEDLALLATVGDDDRLRRRLLALPGFDREEFDRRLRSIGLTGRIGVQ